MALVDNDVMEKLALLDLFEEFESLEVCADGALLLTTARFRYRSGGAPKKLKKKYGEAARDRVVAVSQAGEPLPETTVLLPALVGIGDVDPGEAELFSAAMILEGQHVLTGDKRCIQALALAAAENVAVAAIVGALAGRVMCLEQVMWALVKRHGADVIRARVKAVPGVDMSVTAIFASADLESECRYRIEEVRLMAAGLLHPLQP